MENKFIKLSIIIVFIMIMFVFESGVNNVFSIASTANVNENIFKENETIYEAECIDSKEKTCYLSKENLQDIKTYEIKSKNDNDQNKYKVSVDIYNENPEYFDIDYEIEKDTLDVGEKTTLKVIITLCKEPENLVKSKYKVIVNLKPTI